MYTLFAVLLLVASSLAIRFPSEREKLEAWVKMTMVKNLEDATPNGLDLSFVNVIAKKESQFLIWRHGDRAPTAPMAGERTTEEDWTFGGGGWGELSPIGMQQHFNLGRKLYDRYVDGDKFLSETYKAKEIFIHCTDKNRTVVSAMSNLAGMYSRGKAKVGRDYPDVEGWPTSFIPIPIHTEFGTLDHIGVPTTKCPRQDDLWKLVQKTDDYKKAAYGDFTQETLLYLREATGSDDSDITFDNNIWYPDNVTEWYPYYTKEINEKVTMINDLSIDLVNGILDDNVVDGFDLSVEIPTIRGGPLINDIMAKARGVLQCRIRDSYGQEHSRFEHDTTIAAYLTVLGAKTSVLTDGGYPSYSATILTEFFIDRRGGGTDVVFRIIYHDSADTDFRVITSYVEGCEEDLCPVEILQKLADKFAPPGGIETLCQQRIAV